MKYERYGDSGKETIVFIHGIGASSWMWWQQMPAFDDYQLYLVDLAGHGENVTIPWTDLATTTRMIAEEVIGNQKVHLVGLSLGGHVVLEIAKHYPDKVKSSIISGITVKPMSFKFLMPLQSRLVQRGLRNPARLRRLALEHYGLPAHKVDEFVSNYQLLTRQNYEAIGYEIMSFRLDESYASIDTPTLFVAGGEESKGILESLTVAPQIIASAEALKIPGGHHVWPVQMPDEFNRVVREWVEEFSLSKN